MKRSLTPESDTSELEDTSGKWPEYCRTIIIKGSNGSTKELVFPRALDLDRPKRARTMFSATQLERLEERFGENQYLIGRERVDLARELELTEMQVKVWFQNRRTKQKKDMEKEKGSQPASVSTPPRDSAAAWKLLKLIESSSPYLKTPLQDGAESVPPAPSSLVVTPPKENPKASSRFGDLTVNHEAPRPSGEAVYGPYPASFRSGQSPLGATTVAQFCASPSAGATAALTPPPNSGNSGVPTSLFQRRFAYGEVAPNHFPNYASAHPYLGHLGEPALPSSYPQQSISVPTPAATLRHPILDQSAPPLAIRPSPTRELPTVVSSSLSSSSQSFRSFAATTVPSHFHLWSAFYGGAQASPHFSSSSPDSSSLSPLGQPIRRPSAVVASNFAERGVRLS